MEVRLERLETMRAVHTHALSEAPEEDARTKIVEWATAQGLRGDEARLFGRNTYPTENPEPHGYEVFLTIPSTIVPRGDFDVGEIMGGLYAALRFTDLSRMSTAWRKFWEWIENSSHEHVGWTTGAHGWVNGYEEQLNWYEEKPPSQWVFDLWIPLKE